MATTTTDLVGYWDRYGAGMKPQTPEDALKSAFGWTQYDDHGPGEELLGDPATTLELGFGRGNAVASLATKGIQAAGVDLSPVQVEQARSQWGHLSAAEFHQGDVVETLTHTERRWEAVYSIWGGLWFTDPEALLPLVRERLEKGGRLVFSHAPAVPGSYGVQGMYGQGFLGRQVWVYRWAYEPHVWEDILAGHGFTDVRVWVEPAPEPDHVGTLIGTASR
ncbi:class I SAM-dependent methyltransferase [Nocardiopsis sp. EMB25]|uniref:class I SAM-dependent methyltransferase n=1 Tax=Nocardiopsis TaxID=2013 RepID=UPI00034DAE90|nr:MULTISPECIES: class I SAM-dependent methyltransferase [Nocardiopsis]MCY9786908.1 class I SAM-dependent methyltransferase [Nocardiopsis sp. EMB25]